MLYFVNTLLVYEPWIMRVVEPKNTIHKKLLWWLSFYKATLVNACVAWKVMLYTLYT